MSVGHGEAKRIVDSLPGITPATSLLVRAVAWIDSHYDRDTEPHHNWGFVTAGSKWEGETFSHEDSKWDDELRRKVTYTTAFRAYPSAEAGAAGLWKVLQQNHRAAVKSALDGDWLSVPADLRESRYYLGTKPKREAIADYARALRGALTSITSATGEADPLAGRLSRGTAWLSSAVVSGVAFALFKLAVRKGRR